MLRIFYSPVFKDHRPSVYHLERPERLDTAVDALKARGLWRNVAEPEMASLNDLLEVHSREYVERIQNLSRSFSMIDPDTYVSPGTWEAALKAFGAAREAVFSASGHKGIYLALVRPPGHHAGRNGRAFSAPTLGFCIFNSAAGAAKLAEELEGEAVVIDFDAHHGNGTQEIFWKNPNVIHIDLHERDIYPWSGYEHDAGGKGAEGSKINIPMPHRARDDDYILSWRGIVLPVLEELEPEVVVVSAGFDGFLGESLTTLQLTERFFSYAGSTLSSYSLAVILEGGYSSGLKKGLPAFIDGYLRGDIQEEPIKPSYEAIRVVETVAEIQSEWWGMRLTWG